MVFSTEELVGPVLLFVVINAGIHTRADLRRVWREFAVRIKEPTTRRIQKVIRAVSRALFGSVPPIAYVVFYVAMLAACYGVISFPVH